MSTHITKLAWIVALALVSIIILLGIAGIDVWLRCVDSVIVNGIGKYITK